MKGRGFNLEHTHLQDNEKLKKLVALVSITYALCTSLGIYHHQKVQNIKTKNNGYKANSFTRHGINLIQEWFRLGNQVPEYVQARLKSLIRYIEMQLPVYQYLKIDG